MTCLYVEAWCLATPTASCMPTLVLLFILKQFNLFRRRLFSASRASLRLLSSKQGELYILSVNRQWRSLSTRKWLCGVILLFFIMFNTRPCPTLSGDWVSRSVQQKILFNQRRRPLSLTVNMSDEHLLQYLDRVQIGTFCYHRVGQIRRPNSSSH